MIVILSLAAAKYNYSINNTLSICIQKSIYNGDIITERLKSVLLSFFTGFYVGKTGCPLLLHNKAFETAWFIFCNDM